MGVFKSHTNRFSEACFALLFRKTLKVHGCLWQNSGSANETGTIDKIDATYLQPGNKAGTVIRAPPPFDLGFNFRLNLGSNFGNVPLNLSHLILESG